jgi:Rieske Fe-S protein
MAEQLDRRDALKTLAVGGTGLMLGIPLVMAQNSPVRISELGKLVKDWDQVVFDFEKNKAVLVRLPKPDKPDKRVLEVKGDPPLYLAAHQLVCTHEGCTPALPNAQHQMVCPCHESVFKAEDGSVVSGPAGAPLKGIRLEVKEGAVFALGFVE